MWCVVFFRIQKSGYYKNWIMFIWNMGSNHFFLALRVGFWSCFQLLCPLLSNPHKGSIDKAHVDSLNWGMWGKGKTSMAFPPLRRLLIRHPGIFNTCQVNVMLWGMCVSQEEADGGWYEQQQWLPLSHCLSGNEQNPNKLESMCMLMTQIQPGIYTINTESSQAVPGGVVAAALVSFSHPHTHKSHFFVSGNLFSK